MLFNKLEVHAGLVAIIRRVARRALLRALVYVQGGPRRQLRRPRRRPAPLAVMRRDHHDGRGPLRRTLPSLRRRSGCGDEDVRPAPHVTNALGASYVHETLPHSTQRLQTHRQHETMIPAARTTRTHGESHRCTRTQLEPKSKLACGFRPTLARRASSISDSLSLSLSLSLPRMREK